MELLWLDKNVKTNAIQSRTSLGMIILYSHQQLKVREVNMTQVVTLEEYDALENEKIK